MFRQLSPFFKAPEEGITYPLGVSPEEQPGFFEDTSAAALARENARPKESYVPAGTGPVVEPSVDSTLAPMPSGLRSRVVIPNGGLPAPRPSDINSSIPVASASDKADVPGTVTGAITPTTSTQSAPPADGTSGEVKPPPVEAGSGGDDDVRNLYLARLIAQNAAGFGGMGAGKNIDMGIADTLGERLKQVEALRAKRQEKEVTDAQEVANNKAQVDYLISRFPEQTDSLTKLYGMTRKANFPQFVRLEEQIALDRARAKTEGVKPEVAIRGVAVKEAGQGEKEKEGESRRKLRAAQVAKIYKDMELAGTKLALDERKTIEQAQQSKDPYKKLESLNTIADKKEFGGFTTLAGDLGDLERVAPGFVTRGEVPEWLTREQQLLGQNWPTSTDPRVVDFLAAYGKVANEERHRQYGSAQTDGELRAFMQQLNASPLSAGPQVLAQQVKRFGQAAGRVAKGRLTRYNNVFGAENVATVFSPEWKPLFSEGGVFAAQGSPFASPVRAKAGGAPAPASRMTRMVAPDGSGRYDIPNDKVKAAKAKGWKEQ
jgi:hypothetical protein